MWKLIIAIVLFLVAPAYAQQGPTFNPGNIAQIPADFAISNPSAADPIIAQLPSGAFGVWIGDTYKATPKPYIPNLASTVAPSANIINAPRRMFALHPWSRTAVTVTDDFAAGPDGLTEASRFVVAISTDGFVSRTTVYPNATYTMGVWVKSNTGSSQTFKIGPTASLQTLTATTSWQRFPFTFAANGSTQVFFCRSDGTNAADLLFEDATVYAGSVDLGAEVLAGHAYLGRDAFEGVATVASGILTPSTSYALSLLPAAQTLNGVTVIAIARKNTQLFSLGGMLSNGQSNPALTLFADNNSVQDSNFSGGTIAPATPPYRYPNLWLQYQKGWAGFGMRHDLTTGALWLDDIKLMQRTPQAKSANTLEDTVIGAVLNGASVFNSDYQVAAAAAWGRALSDSEYRTAYAALAARVLAKSGLAITAERIVIGEGDSITAGVTGTMTNGGYVKLSAANLNPYAHGYNNAVNGSNIAGLVSRATILDAIIPPSKAGRKFILAEQIGHNDEVGGATTAQFLIDLASYLDGRHTAGFLTVCGTVLHSTVNGGFNAWADTVNTTIKTWTGTHCDAIADYASDVNLLDASNLTYFQADGTHPTDAGEAAMEPYLTTAVNGL